MKTITFDESINISKNHFKTVEDFQIHLVDTLQKSELNQHQKAILEERIQEANENPANYISLEQLKIKLHINFNFFSVNLFEIAF
jgi:hypothetical protein